jgi:GTP-binding protein
LIDTVRINIKAGNGGNGCVSFLREKFRPRGGPNGGDGGDGGNAYIVGDPSLNTLINLKFNSTFYVERGEHGRGKDQRGANASDTSIYVPLGTIVWRIVPDSNGEKAFLADIIDETPVLVAQGGKGGWGNTHYVTSTNQTPMLSQQGGSGDWIVLFLELKLLADVGLLAKPNAGKSTLISRCSAAKPRIADYPFTTVEPILGVVSTRGRDFVMMEVPGLIEGAHEGVGLGDQFLRHAERARVYVHLIDGLSPDPVADYHMINDELRQFNPEMVVKSQIIAVSKMDVTDVRDRREELAFVLEEELTSINGEKPMILFISAVSGEGIDQLLGCIVELLDSLPKDVPLEVSEPELVAAGGGLPQVRRGNSFHREGDVFVVQSEQLERLSALADMRDYRVLLQLWREMTRLGIARRLQEAGIEAGDTIRIGKAEMEWF